VDEIFKKLQSRRFSEDKPITLISSQLQLLKTLAKGETLVKTAEILNITYESVRKRTKLLYKKFSVHNRLELIRKAVELNFLSTREVTAKFRARFVKFGLNLFTKNKNIPLTAQELYYLYLKFQGKTAKHIAEEMKLYGVFQVQYIKDAICRKFEVDNIRKVLIMFSL